VRVRSGSQCIGGMAGPRHEIGIVEPTVTYRGRADSRHEQSCLNESSGDRGGPKSETANSRPLGLFRQSLTEFQHFSLEDSLVNVRIKMVY